MNFSLTIESTTFRQDTGISVIRHRQLICCISTLISSGLASILKRYVDNCL